MPPRSLQQRLTLLEEKVAQLEASPVSTPRDELRHMHDDLARRLETVGNESRQRDEDLVRRIDTANEESRRHMRVLYEDLVTRIATIG